MATFTYAREFDTLIPEMSHSGTSPVWASRQADIETNYTEWADKWYSWYPNANCPEPWLPQQQFYTGGDNWHFFGPMIGDDNKAYYICQWLGYDWDNFLVCPEDRNMIPLVAAMPTRDWQIDSSVEKTGLITPNLDHDWLTETITGTPDTDMLWWRGRAVPIKGTNSFWCTYWWGNTQPNRYRKFFAVRYSIQNITTVTREQAIWEYCKGSNDPGTWTDPYTFRHRADRPIDTYHDGTYSYIACAESDSVGSYSSTPISEDFGYNSLIYRFPHDATNTDTRTHASVEHRITDVDFGPYAWERFTVKFGEKYPQRASFVETNGALEMLMFIPKPAEDIVTLDTPCPIETNSPGPRIYRAAAGSFGTIADYPAGTGYTDISSLFGIPWSDNDNPTYQNWDGTEASGRTDDYHMYTWKVGTEWFVGFTRVYDDNNLYTRIRVYNWNDGAPQPFLDLQDVKIGADVNGNGTIFDRYNEERVVLGQTVKSESYRAGYEYGSYVDIHTPALHYNPQNNKLVWSAHIEAQESSQPADGYMLVNIGTFGVGAPPSSSDIYFSDFVEKDDYQDWIIGMASGAEFEAVLETYYHMNDDAQWKQTPYVYTYLNAEDNIQIVDSGGDGVTTLTDFPVTAGDDIGLTLSGKWDWIT